MCVGPRCDCSLVNGRDAKKEAKDENVDLLCIELVYVDYE